MSNAPLPSAVLNLQQMLQQRKNATDKGYSQDWLIRNEEALIQDISAGLQNMTKQSGANLLENIDEETKEWLIKKDLIAVDFPNGLKNEAAALSDPIFLPLSAEQIRLWLLQNGKTDADVEKAISNFKSPLREQAQIRWEYASDFKRNSPFIHDLAAAIGWPDDWLDAEWRKATEL